MSCKHISSLLAFVTKQISCAGTLYRDPLMRRENATLSLGILFVLPRIVVGLALEGSEM
jgi:hypothetical protein